MNDKDSRFPTCSSKIVDIVAFDKNGMADEKKLIRIIRDAVINHPEVRVWNLSFAILQRPVVDHQFSRVAMLLEELRAEHGVSFVVAAGNTDKDELAPQPWPRPIDPSDRDRVCSPADAPTAIVVGGAAHLAKADSCVAVGEPSPWTRRGPGAAFLSAPHISHIAGNCSSDGDHARVGVYSVDGLTNLIEDVGTSYASPLVANLLSHVTAEVSKEAEPQILSHALLLHSAFLKNAPIDPQRFKYEGVGTPPDLDQVLHCRQSSATIIFEVDFGNAPVATKYNFPFPNGMRDGDNIVGEVLMTLAYVPPMRTKGDFEYCGTNVTASLGTPDK